MQIIAILIILILIVILFSKQSKMSDEIARQKSIINLLTEQIRSLTTGSASKETRLPPLSTPASTPASVSTPVPVSAPNAASNIKDALKNTERNVKNDTLTQPIVNKQPKPRQSLFKNEDWVGVNLFNRLGILLVLIGTIAIAAFEGFPPLLRTSILFLSAFVFIGFGEFMNRKKPTIFSIGLSATGVALAYVATAASFFALETLNMYTALIACIVATAIGVFLATRYKAQVIGCFALIGGYLPIFALDPFNNPMLVAVMVYFVLLSLFSLLLSLTHKWTIMNTIGFILTVAGVSYLGWRADPTIALIYACFAFFLYTALPLIATHRTKGKFSEFDFLLIIVNTLVSSIVIFAIAYRLDIDNLQAYLCIAFSVIYAGVAYLVKRKFAHKNMQTLFTITAIVFAFLFVPFFFEERWFVIGWATQAVVLAGFGILHSRKIAEYSGLAILLISGWALSYSFFYYEGQFTLNYLILTAVASIIGGLYIAKGRHKQGYEQAYKIFAFANLWIFAMYIISDFLNKHIFNILDNSPLEYLIAMSLVAVTFALAYIYYKVRIWSDIGMRILANVMHFATIIGVVGISISFGFSQNIGDNFRLILNLIAVVIGFDMALQYYLKESRSNWVVVYKNINIVALSLMLVGVSYVLMAMAGFFGAQMVSIILLFILAFVMTRVPAISDRAVQIIAISIYVIGLLWLWVFNLAPYTSSGLVFLNGAVQIMALVALHDIITFCGDKGKLSAPKILALSIYFLLVVTQSMLVQTDIAFNNAIISLMYAAAAFAWIIVGFRLKIKSLRKAGLFLSMVAVAKLLIVDTWGLSTEMRIVSYISLGLILMLISFIYQKLSKKMEE